MFVKEAYREGSVYCIDAHMIDSTCDGSIVQYAHDVDESETGRAGITYDWSERGEMVKRTDPVGMQTYWYYRYDGLGRRVRKHTSSLAPKTYFLYDPSGRLVYEMVFDSTQRDKVRERRNYYYLGDRPFGIRESGAAVTAGNYWLVTDHLNTPWKTLSSTGTASWSGTYYPFGNLRTESGTTRLGNLRFPGQYHDRESSLYYNVYRYYRPGDGRYTSADRRLNADYSSYSYVDNRPTTALDPLGLAIIDPTCSYYLSQIAVAMGTAIAALRSGECLSETNDCDDECDDDYLEERAVSELLNTTYVCVMSTSAEGPCAETGYGSGNPTYLYIPLAFNGQCGCLSGVLLHEALHRTACRNGYFMFGDNCGIQPNAYDRASGCLPCALDCLERLTGPQQ